MERERDQSTVGAERKCHSLELGKIKLVSGLLWLSLSEHFIRRHTADACVQSKGFSHSNPFAKAR